MSYIEDKNFSSVFGNAADGIEFDKVLEAEEDDELIEQVLSLDESSDGNDDFHETTGENDKSPEDIEEELEGRPDDGDNDHTNTFDIDMADEAALEAALMEAESGIDFAETTGENDKTPKDIEEELEGRPDDACNKHTGTFDPENGSDLSMGDYGSAEYDLDNMEDAANRAAGKGEDLYTAGKLSTEAAEDELDDDALEAEVEAALMEADADNGIEEGEDPDPGYDMDNFEGTEDYYGQEDFDGVAESGEEDDFDDEDEEDPVDESANDDPDDDGDLIDAADEEDGQMTQAEVEALVAAGGDDDILDSM